MASFGDAFTIKGPVGIRNKLQSVKNLIVDQQTIIDALASIAEAQGGKQNSWSTKVPDPGSKDGLCPPDLANAISDFQTFWKAQGHLAVVDGVVDPDKKTIKQMNALAAWDTPRDPMIRFSPEGQLDGSACWAACYAWWLRVMPGLTAQRQVDILGSGTSANIVNRDGTVDLDGFLRFLNQRHSPLAGKWVTPDKFVEQMAFADLGNQPVIVGFKTGPAIGHVNVVHAFFSDRKIVSAMDPWFPDPEVDIDYDRVLEEGQIVYEERTTRVPFQFKGQHVRRQASYYTANTFSNGMLMIFPALDL